MGQTSPIWKQTNKQSQHCVPHFLPCISSPVKVKFLERVVCISRFHYHVSSLCLTPGPQAPISTTSMQLLPSTPQSPKLLTLRKPFLSLSYLTPERWTLLPMPSLWGCSFLSFISLWCPLLHPPLKYRFPQRFALSSLLWSLYTLALGNLIPLAIFNFHPCYDDSQLCHSSLLSAKPGEPPAS